MTGKGDDILEWLSELGLTQYVDAFAENDIDLDILKELTAQDLREVGVKSVGHRRRILTAAAEAARGKSEREALNAQPEPDQPSPPAAPDRSGERRNLTVMFCDLMDSTATVVQADPEDFREFLDKFRQRLEDVVAQFSGHVAQYVGDGLLVLFGYPSASEHDAENAVAAGLAIIEAVADMEPFAGRQQGVRIGIATGLTVLGGTDRLSYNLGDSAVGETPNLAARLQAIADANTVIVSSSTRKLISNLFECGDLGTFNLKGFDKPVRAWRVDGHGRAENRFGALRSGQKAGQFVGREPEMTRLRNRLVEASSGLGQFVVITAESGIGKSRLVHQIVEEVGRPHVPVLQCTPYYAGSAFHPFRKLLQQASGASHDDSHAQMLEKLRAFLRANQLLSRESLRLLADLLRISVDDDSEVDSLARLSPQDLRQKTMSILLDVLTAVASSAPISVVEDIQWIDPSTAELIGRFCQRLVTMPVLLLATMRPQKHPDWLVASPARFIELDRLSRYDMIRLISSLTGDIEAPKDVIDVIIERSDGIPIFAEELTRGYVDALREGGDAVNAWQKIPDSLTDSLMARLDRLKVGRELALTAAVIGHEFPIDVLIAVSGLEEAEARGGIDELLGAYVLVIGHSQFGEAISFRHMLMRDAAYELQLRRDRIKMHLHVAATLLAHFPIIASAVPNVVALHLESGGDHVNAAHYWNAACEQAQKRSAYVEALGYNERAIAANDECPPDRARDERELTYRLSGLSPLIASSGYSTEQVSKQTERVVALSRSLGASDKLLPALAAKWVSHASMDLRGRFEMAHQMLEAARTGSEVDKLLAHRMTATTNLFAGKFDVALHHIEQFFSIYDFDKHEEGISVVGPSNHALMMMLGRSEIYTIIGEYPKGEAWRDKALERAQKMGSAHNVCHLMLFAGCWLSALREEFDTLHHYAKRLEQLAGENDLPWLHHSKIFRGLSLIVSGDRVAGYALASEGAKALTDSNAFRVSWRVIYCDVCLRTEHYDEALQHIELAQPAQDAGELWMAGEFAYVRSKLAIQRGEPRDAIDFHLQSGLELARSQGAKLFVDKLTALAAQHDKCTPA